MRKSTKLKIFRRKKRSVILSVLKRHSLRQHTETAQQQDKNSGILQKTCRSDQQNGRSDLRYDLRDVKSERTTGQERKISEIGNCETSSQS